MRRNEKENERKRKEKKGEERRRKEKKGEERRRKEKKERKRKRGKMLTHHKNNEVNSNHTDYSIFAWQRIIAVSSITIKYILI